MAALPTIVPNGTVLAGNWQDEAGGTTDLHSPIDETGAADTVHIRSITDSDGTPVRLDLSAMPADFATMGTGLAIEIRHSRGTVEGGSAGAGDDTMTLSAVVVSSGGGNYTDEVQIETGTQGYASKTEVVNFTVTSSGLAAPKSEWDNAQLWIRSTTTRNMGADSHRHWVDFARLINGTYNLAYNLNLTAFRLRNDDGSETAATWKAAENTDASIDLGEVFRVRFVVQNDSATVAADDLQLGLDYKINAGTYIPITTTTSNGVHVLGSTHITDQEVTTEQLIAGTGTFEPGVVSEGPTAGTANIIDIPASGFTEVEFVVRTIYDAGSSAVSPGDTVTFRLRRRLGSSHLDFTTYTEEPVVTLIGYPARWTTMFWGQLAGPFEASNGDLFTVMPSLLVQTQNDQATVWRKPSGGNWSQVASLDSVNGHGDTDNGVHRYCVAHADGDTLHIVWATFEDTSIDSSAGLNYAAWNMSTNTQIGSVEEIATFGDDPGEVAVDLTIRTRSDGDVVISYTLLDLGSNTSSVELVHGSAGSWTLTTVESSDANLGGTTIVVDQSNDDTHAFWTYVSGSGMVIRHERMNASGTLSGTVDAVSTASGTFKGFMPSAIASGGTQRSHDAVIFDGDFFVLDANELGTAKVWQGTVGDDPSDWAATTLATTSIDDLAQRNHQAAIGLIEAGGRLFAAWVRESDQHIVYQEYTGSWGSVTDTSIVTAFENAFVCFRGQVVSGNVILYGFYNINTDSPSDAGPHARAKDFSFNLGAVAGGGGGGTTFSGWYGYLQGW